MAIADGVYSIETAMDGLWMDIDGISLANQANLMTGNRNDGNNQKFKVTTTGSYRQFFACHSNKVLEVYGTLVAKNQANISQFTSNNGINQKWTFTDKNDSTGTAGVVIRSAMSSSYVMDSAYAVAQNRANIWLHTYNGGDNQIWVFQKDTFFDSSLPVPSNVGVTYTATETSWTSGRAIAGTKTLYPAWIGGAGGFQLRYRTRGRLTGTDSWGAWVSWRSPSGATTDQGWGNAWAQTGSDTGTSSTRRYASGISFTVDQVTYDRLQVQMEVRRFQFNGNATFGNTHGGSSTGTINIYYAPTITWNAVSFAHDGLRLAYSSDFKRNDNTFTLTLKVNGKTLVDSFTTNEMGYDDTILIPLSKLRFIPEDGDKVVITCKHKRDYTRTTTATKTISYESGHGSAISATWEESDGFTEIVNLGNHATTEVYLLIESGAGNRFVKCDEIESGSHRIVYPFNKAYKVFCVTTDGSDKWATKMFERENLAQIDFYIWNYADTYTILKENPSASRSVGRDYESNLTSGREFEAVAFGAGSVSELNISGDIYHGYEEDNSRMIDFERLAVCDYAIYRTPYGGYHEVGVISLTDSNVHTPKHSVNIRMKEHS